MPEGTTSPDLSNLSEAELIRLNQWVAQERKKRESAQGKEKPQKKLRAKTPGELQAEKDEQTRKEMRKNIKSGKMAHELELFAKITGLQEVLEDIQNTENHPDREIVWNIGRYFIEQSRQPSLSEWTLPVLRQYLKDFRKTRAKEKPIGVIVDSIARKIKEEVETRVSHPDNYRLEYEKIKTVIDADSLTGVVEGLRLLIQFSADEESNLPAAVKEQIAAYRKELEYKYYEFRKQEQEKEAQREKEEKERLEEEKKKKPWLNSDVFEKLRDALSGSQENSKHADAMAKEGHDYGSSAAMAAINAVQTRPPAVEFDYVKEFYTDKGYAEYDTFVSKIGADWRRFGWTDQNKDTVVNTLQSKFSFSPTQAIAIRNALLMHGATGDLSLDFLNNQATLKDLRRNLFEEFDMVDDLMEDDSTLEEKLYPDLIEREARRVSKKKERSREYQDEPENLEAFASQVEFSDEEMFGKHGKYPVFRRMVKIIGQGNNQRLETRKIVRTDNLTMWLRERVNYLDGQKSTEPVDFYNEIHLRKTFSPLTLTKIFEDSARIFRDRDGNHFEFLDTQWQLEAIMYSVIRTFALNFQKGCGREEEILKTLEPLYFFNILTRPIYQRSLFYWLNILSERFKSTSTDSKLGTVINTLFLTYSNIGNDVELKRILRVDSLDSDPNDEKEGLFNLFHLRKVREEMFMGSDGKGGIRKTTGETTDEDNYAFDLSDNNKTIRDIFDLRTGRIKPKKMAEFLSFINLFNSQGKNDHLIKLVRKIVTDRAVKLHGLETKVNVKKENGVVKEEGVGINKNIADMMGYSLAWFMGGATQMDNAFQGYNAEVRLSEYYREKQLELKKRGGAAGNMFTFAQFKRYLMVPMHAITALTKGEHGNGKTIYELFEDLMLRKQVIDARLDQLPEGTDQEKRAKETLRKQLMQEYQNMAALFSFDGNAMRDYYLNHYVRAFSLDKMIRGAEELKFEKYTRYVPEVGVTFDTKEFQDDFKKRLVTTARYAFSTYAKLNFNQKIWAWDKRAKAFRKMPMGEAMFGYQMLDIPEFWKDGERHVIDYKKVNSNKDELFKRWILTYVGGQILEHRSNARWATGLRHEFTYYEDIYEALAKIPGNILTDPGSMEATNVTEFFFSKAQLDWLRKISGTERWWLYGGSFLKGLLFSKRGSKEKALEEAVGIFVQALFHNL